MRQVRGLQSATRVGYKVRWVWDYKVRQNGLQSATGITKCDRVDYKVRQGLQSATGLQSETLQALEKIIHE